MGKTKVLLDTNIYISALGWHGRPREVFQKCVKGELELVTSPEQMTELRRVMDYPKFSFSEEQKERFISLIMEIATLVKITGKMEVVKEDPDDDIIVETGFVGMVNYIISGDPHLLKLREFRGIYLITAHEFLEKGDW